MAFLSSIGKDTTDIEIANMWTDGNPSKIHCSKCGCQYKANTGGIIASEMWLIWHCSKCSRRDKNVYS